jgi:NAD+ kinase
MIRIHTHVNGIFMNTYWADGLIASTPTGSTAYSLSCGGPIVTPESNNLILTPIAAHNLTVRPVVLPNTHEITLRAEGRSPELLLSIDSTNHQIGPDVVISLTKAPFDFHLMALEGQDFFHTIRTKMGWGLDKRN